MWALIANYTGKSALIALMAFFNLVETVIATATLLIVNIQTNVLQVMVHCFPFSMA